MTEHITPPHDDLDRQQKEELDFFNDAARRAREAIDAQPEAQTEKQPPSRRAKKLAVGALIAVGAITGITPAVAANMGPSFTASEEKTGFTAYEGSTLTDATHFIEGSENVNTSDLTESIRSDPANAGVFEDGQFNPGETVSIPVSVKPR